MYMYRVGHKKVTRSWYETHKAWVLALLGEGAHGSFIGEI